MRILIVSDTHGQLREYNEVLKKTKPIDYLIHAGDVEEQESAVAGAAGCPSTIVRGNNDFLTDLRYDEVVELGNHRIFVTHGHLYGVSMDTAMLRDEAISLECDIAVFGHTHRPLIDQSDPRLTLLNPGSLALPRQEGREPSYIMMEIDRMGEAHYTVNFLKRGPSGRRRRFF